MIAASLAKCAGMQIEYQLTHRDFKEAFAAHRNRTPAKKWTIRILIILVLGIWAFLLWGSLLAHNTKEMMPFFVMAVLWIIFMMVFRWWSIRRQFLKQPRVQGPLTLVLDSTGAQWRWNGGSANCSWKNYIRLVEGKSQILFYTSPASFSFLPKRVLTPEQLNELRTLLRENFRPDRP